MRQTIESPDITQTVRGFYENHPYPGQHYPLFKKDAKRLSAFMPRRGRVLFPGCGTGQTMIALAALRSDLTIYGIDLSNSAIRHAKRLAGGQPTVFLASGDFTASLPWDLKFTYIVCEGVLHHVPNAAAALRALVTLLESDGRIFMNLYGESYHRRRLEIVEMLNILEHAAGEDNLDRRFDLYRAYRTTEFARRSIANRFLETIRQIATGKVQQVLAYFRMYQADSLRHDRGFSQPEAAWVDQYAHPFERTFNTLDVKRLLEEADLEVVEMLYLGRPNEAILPGPWRPLFRRLDRWTQFRLMELYDPFAGSIYLWARRKL